jgi:hypothetical protein
MNAVQQHRHSEGAVSYPAAPSAGLTDAEWDARIEALWQLANTNAAAARGQVQQALEEVQGQRRIGTEPHRVARRPLGLSQTGLV